MDENYSFDLKKYTIISRIGCGAFGEVFKVKESDSNQIYAAKVSLREIGSDGDYKDQIKNMVREVNLMSKINHPSIVKFFGFSETDFKGDPRQVLVTEFLPRGSLGDLIKSEMKWTADHQWDDTHKLILLYGVASAMEYLHAHNIIHRDLKPDNILMDENLYPKIADFGLAKSSNDASISKSATGIKGSYLYMAPESHKSYEYTPASDVYAFSMIAYEIITEKVPFIDEEGELISPKKNYWRPSTKIHRKFHRKNERIA